MQKTKDMKFLYAKQAADNSVLINIEKVDSIDTADQDVIVNAQTGAATSVTITLSVTDGKESVVAKALAEMLCSSSSKVIELGDEVEGSYFHSDVTAVEAVTVDIAQA